MPHDKDSPPSAATERPTAGLPWRSLTAAEPPLDPDPGTVALHEVLATSAASAPALPALTFCLRSTPYGALQATVERVATALARDGLRPGDLVSLDLPDAPETLAAALGALRAGAVLRALGTAGDDGGAGSGKGEGGSANGAAPAVHLATAPRLALRPPPAGARVVIVDPAKGLRAHQRVIVGLARAVRRPLAPETRGPSWGRWLSGVAAAPDAPEPGPAAAALVTPAGTFRHAHLVAGAAQIKAHLMDALPGEETWLPLLPLLSPTGLATAGAALALRARLALLPDWRTEDALDALRYLRPSWVVADAEAVERLAQDPALARADLRSVRGWLVAGPLAEPAARAFEEASGLALCPGWSPPTAAGFATCAPIDGRRVPGTVGRPLAGVLLRGAGGRLVAHGPNLLDEGAAAVGVVDAAGRARLGPAPR